MRALTVVLGGVRYEVQRPPALRAARWRRQAEALLERMPQISALYTRDAEAGGDLVEATLRVYREAGEIVEQIAEVVLAADPQLEADRARIEETVTEEELMEGLQMLLLLNAPLAALARAMATPPTPAQNGAAMPTT